LLVQKKNYSCVCGYGQILQSTNGDTDTKTC